MAALTISFQWADFVNMGRCYDSVSVDGTQEKKNCRTLFVYKVSMIFL